MEQATSNPAGSPRIKDTTAGPSAPEGRTDVPEEFQRFQDLAGKVAKVPKSEVDEARRKA